MGLETLPKILTDAYKIFDQLNLSVTSLVVIGILLSLAFLFAAREAAAWFFKVDDIKKDVRKLRQVVIDLEGEMRSLQGLLNQNIALAHSAVNENATFAKTAATRNTISTTAVTSTTPTTPAPTFATASTATSAPAKPATPTASAFPINH